MNDTREVGRGAAGPSRVERLLERRVEERTRELTALLEVSRSLSSTLALEPLLDLILEQLLRVIDYRSAAIMVARDDALETVAMRDTRDPARDRSQVGYRTPMAHRFAVWEAVLRGESVVIGDVRHDDNAFARAWRTLSTDDPGPTQSPVRSWLGVPLAAQGAVFGVLPLTRDVPDSFTTHDTEMALAFAGHAATAIENARLLAESEQRNAELAALLDVARGAASTLELEPLLNTILDTLKLVVDYAGASIGVVEGDEFRFLESRGASSAEREPEMIGVRLPLRGRSGLWEPLFRHEPVIIADVRDDSEAAQAFRHTVGAYYDAPAMRYLRAFMGIPLVNRDRLVGLLTLTNREPGVFTARHAGLALAIATHIAAALENARLYGEAQGKAALEERARLARDLHDSVTQSVFSVGLLANAALGQYERGMPVEDALRRIKAVSHDALAELRALLYELHPAALAAEGLAKALAKLVAALQVRVDVPITFVGETARRLSPEAETAVFRIVQEALGNAAKYAQATELRVTLVETETQLGVTVADDGVGYDPQAPVTPAADGRSGGLGLPSMRARAATAGLTLRIESAPGAGTRVTVTAPLA